MAFAAEAFLDIPREPDYFQLQDNYGWIITVALNVGVVQDLIICVSLCFYIRQLYTPYNLPKCVQAVCAFTFTDRSFRSEELIHRLIVWTIREWLFQIHHRVR